MMSHMATKEELLRDSLKLQEELLVYLFMIQQVLDQDSSEIISHLHEKLDISIGFMVTKSRVRNS